MGKLITSGFPGPISLGTLGASSTSLGAWLEITPSGGFSFPIEGFYLYAFQESGSYGGYFQFGLGPTPNLISSQYLYLQNQGYIQNKLLIPIEVDAGTAVYIRGFSGSGATQSFSAQMFAIPKGSGIVNDPCSQVDSFLNGNYAGLPGFLLSTNASPVAVTTTRSNQIAKNMIFSFETGGQSSTNFNLNLYTGPSTSALILLDSIPAWSGSNNYTQNNSQFPTKLPPGSPLYFEITGATGTAPSLGAWLSIFY